MTTTQHRPAFRLPDRPEREPDDMTSFRQLADTGIIEPLRHYLGRPETTLITGEQYLCRFRTRNMAGARYPDLLIAFDVDLEAHELSNGYVIAEQGKPPDFVLEIASARTGGVDVGRKRRDYARMGIPEYWRFDATGEHHGRRLAGDRLGADGRYHPMLIEETADGGLQGYSPALDLRLRWENGRLRWYDPVIDRPIATFTDERAARIQAQEEASREYTDRVQAQEEARRERADRIQAQEEARREREARLQAEARARELEARLENLGNP